MNMENAKSQMRKGMLDYCIMLILHQGSAYASDILQKLKDAELIVVEGTLYPLLTRLKNDGLLSYEWQESTQGPPRKYYRLSSDGETALSYLNSAWQELSGAIGRLSQQRPTGSATESQADDGQPAQNLPDTSEGSFLTRYDHV